MPRVWSDTDYNDLIESTKIRMLSVADVTKPRSSHDRHGRVSSSAFTNSAQKLAFPEQPAVVVPGNGFSLTPPAKAARSPSCPNTE